MPIRAPLSLGIRAGHGSSKKSWARHSISSKFILSESYGTNVIHEVISKDISCQNQITSNGRMILYGSDRLCERMPPLCCRGCLRFFGRVAVSSQRCGLQTAALRRTMHICGKHVVRPGRCLGVRSWQTCMSRQLHLRTVPGRSRMHILRLLHSSLCRSLERELQRSLFHVPRFGEV